MIFCCCAHRQELRIRNWRNGGRISKSCRKKNEWRWCRRVPRNPQRKERPRRAGGAVAGDAAERRAVNNGYALAPRVRGDRQQLRISARAGAGGDGATRCFGCARFAAAIASVYL